MSSIRDDTPTLGVDYLANPYPRIQSLDSGMPPTQIVNYLRIEDNMTETRIELCVCCDRRVAEGDEGYRIRQILWDTVYCRACYTGCDPEYKCEVTGKPSWRHPDYVDD